MSKGNVMGVSRCQGSCVLHVESRYLGYALFMQALGHLIAQGSHTKVAYQ